MYDDILGPRDEKEKKPKKPKNKINMNKVCYDCGNPYEECECEEGFGIDGDLEDLELELEEDPWAMDDDGKCDCSDDDDCDEDCGCIGVGALDNNIPPEQDIGCLKNDEGRNCEGQCKTCEMYDCMYQYLD